MKLATLTHKKELDDTINVHTNKTNSRKGNVKKEVTNKISGTNRKNSSFNSNKSKSEK